MHELNWSFILTFFWVQLNKIFSIKVPSKITRIEFWNYMVVCKTIKCFGKVGKNASYSFPLSIAFLKVLTVVKEKSWELYPHWNFKRKYFKIARNFHVHAIFENFWKVCWQTNWFIVRFINPWFLFVDLCNLWKVPDMQIHCRL